MASELSLTGIVSGVDWEAIIEKLMEIEHRPVDLLEQRKEEYENKLSAWQQINTKLLSLKSASEMILTEEDFNLFKVELFSENGNPEDIILVNCDSNAVPGTYTLRVLSVAKAESIQSKSFSQSTSSLGISGEILINGKLISISESDSLSDIAGKINSADASVKASIIKIDEEKYRLTITSENTGSSGIVILNASPENVLQELGIAGSTKTVLHQISSGAKSNYFSDSSTAVGTLLSLSNPPSGTVIIAGVSVDIDLSLDSLDDIANKINNAWQAAGNTGNIAEVGQDENGYFLKINTTNITDSNNVMEALGILKSEQEDTFEIQMNTNQLTSSGSPVTESTLITEIDTDTGNPKPSETITIKGTDHNGNPVESVFTITDTSTVGDLLQAIEDTFNNTVTATLTPDGYIQIKDNEAGSSFLSVSLIANNEKGGGLDFGQFTEISEGYSMEVSAGEDAKIEINGNTVVSSSNTISDVIPGVVINLKKEAPDTLITLEVKHDIDSIAENIKNFFNTANDLISYINSQYEFDEENPPPLMGDFTLQMLKMDLTDALREPVSGIDSNKNYLAWIGIEADDHGIFSIDENKLKERLSDSFEDVKNLFISSDGIAKRTNELISNLTDTSENGYVVTRIDTLNDTILHIEEQIEDMEKALEVRRRILEMQYYALEQLIAQMNQMTSWIAQQFSIYQRRG